MRKRICYFVAGFWLLALLANPPAAEADPLLVTDGLVQGFANLFGSIQQYEGQNFTLHYTGPSPHPLQGIARAARRVPTSRWPQRCSRKCGR
jgi:hypothetical protein